MTPEPVGRLEQLHVEAALQEIRGRQTGHPTADDSHRRTRTCGGGPGHRSLPSSGVLRGAWCVLRGALCVVRCAWCVVRGVFCVGDGMLSTAPRPTKAHPHSYRTAIGTGTPRASPSLHEYAARGWIGSRSAVPMSSRCLLYTSPRPRDG